MLTESEIQKNIADQIQIQSLSVASLNDIKISVKNETVTLNGTVDTYFKKQALEQAVTSAGGIKTLINKIEVNTPQDLSRSDKELEEIILFVMKMNTSIPEEDIKVKVDNGWVTLSGIVDWDFQQRTIKKSVANIIGVKGMVNQIKINSKSADSIRSANQHQSE